VTALREILAKFGIEVDTNPLKAADKSVDSTIGQLGKLGAMLAATYSIGQIRAFIDEQIQGAVALKKAAEIAGVAVGQFEQLEAAFYLGGVAEEQFRTGLRFLNRNMAQAMQGAGPAAKAFKALGIDVKDATTGGLRGAPEVLAEVADAIAALEPGPARTGMAMTLFGRGGQAMLPMLSKGSAGMAELSKRAAELGVDLDETFVRQASAINKNLKEQKIALGELSETLVQVAAPAILYLAQAGTKAYVALIKLGKEGRIASAALFTGLSVLSAMLPRILTWVGALAARWLLPIAGALALYIVLEDIAGWFAGNDSLIGRFFAETLGQGANQAGQDVAAAFGVMVESWVGFEAGMRAGVGLLATLSEIAWVEISNGFIYLCATMQDAWDKFASGLTIPAWLRVALDVLTAGGFTAVGTLVETNDNNKGGTFNKQIADKKWDRDRRGVAENWEKMTGPMAGMVDLRRDLQRTGKTKNYVAWDEQRDGVRPNGEVVRKKTATGDAIPEWIARGSNTPGGGVTKVSKVTTNHITVNLPKTADRNIAQTTADRTAKALAAIDQNAVNASEYQTDG
jgi:hypothetical protein